MRALISLLLLSSAPVDSLRAAVRTPAARMSAPVASARPLKVAIAGGGVGGLTTALGLLKAGFDVTLYEKTGQFARFGGPIQFASNALSTLKAVDERLFERVMEKFTFTGTRRCGIKDGLRADGKFSMTEVADPRYLFDASVPADWYLQFPLKECADFFQLPYTGVINRPDLQEILLDECRAIKSDFIVNGRAVESYAQKAQGGVAVSLADGSTVDADVLVGSDGIWSAVRAQMYDEGPVKAKSADGLTQQGCPYSGYTVFAGEFVPTDPSDFSDYFECGYKVYIGPKKYFVTSDVGDGRVQWYSFLAQPPGTNRAGDSWEEGSTTEEEGSDVISYLKGLHEGWTDEIHYVLDSTPTENVEQRDLYDRWPEFKRSWADGSVVLVGDAVHPMMPNLGQGGCQAIEDAYVLAETLKAVTVNGAAPADPKAVERALQSFYQKRVYRCAGVSLLSRLASDLIVNFFDTPWSPHDDKGRGPLAYLTFFWKPILQYLVFPIQFLFLYSYHPTGGMGELPAQLVAAWEERHRTSAAAAFEKAAKEGQSASAPSFFAATANAAADVAR
jgi:zeaxanthin epoxidase